MTEGKTVPLKLMGFAELDFQAAWTRDSVLSPIPPLLTLGCL